MKKKWSLDVQHVTTVKPNLENTFSKVLPRGNWKDRKLINVMKVFICNVTQRKVHFLTNYFQKQLRNLAVSYICYLKQEHSVVLSKHLYAKHHMQYAAEHSNGNHAEQHILNAYLLLLVLIRTSAT